mmetsp:Transcript_14940/g.63057  ORF Transcript_14940/g.63057 Transcript_14940/m.63057 type:complete len:845 (+) Transcript_14940:501-3035(+)
MYPFGGGSRAAPRRPARPRVFSFALREPSFEDRHVGGVNAIVARGDVVLTGGRDGTIREWVAPGVSTLGCSSRLEGTSEASASSANARSFTAAHAGWVNALTPLAGDLNVLVSGGADRAVKLWRRDAEETETNDKKVGGLTLVSTLERHADYVTRVAAPETNGGAGGGVFVSAGLGQDQVFLWDAETASSNKQGVAAQPLARFGGQTDSAYALATDAAGAVVVTGDNKGVVRRWDARAPHERATRLVGHAGTVRCASVDPTGRLCLTGSSDGAVRLWDLGANRCVQTFSNTHGCSVWSAAPDASWRSVVSGGADGAVYVTDLAKRRSRLLFREAGGVIDLRRDEEATKASSTGSGFDEVLTVWAATSASDAARWSARLARDDASDREHEPVSPGSSLRARAERMSLGSSSRKDSGWFAAGTSPGMSPARRSFGGGGWSPGGGAGRGIDERREDDALALRTAVIAGAPPAVAHAQLPDRRRVLARDAAGGMALWDVTAFKVVRRWPRLSVSEDGASAEASTSREGNASAVSFEARSAARFETTLEALKNELGPVSVPSWFAADNRSGSLAVTLSPSGAFQAEGYARELGARDASDETKVNFGVQTLHALLRKWAKKRRVASNGARDPNGDVGEDVDVLVSDESKRNEKTFDVDKCGPCDDARLFATPNANDFSPTFFFEPPELPYDPTSAAAGPPGRAVVLMDGSSMLGTDVEEALLPEWVVDVAAERYKVPDAPKASFYIAEHPEEEGRESALASGKGTAITSGKVTAPRVLSVRKVCSYVVAKLGLDLSDDVAVEDAVEIFCDGKKLDPSWSLATVREHVWRRGDDLRVTFRVTEAVAKPAGE